MIDDKPLMQSGVSPRIWALYKTDVKAFRHEVVAYFALCYPGYTVVRADPTRRIIWLRDDRGRK